MFLKLDGITGDSTDDGHKNQIDVSSFAFAVGRGGDGTGSGGRGAAGRSHLQTMRIDKSTTRPHRSSSAPRPRASTSAARS